MGLFYMDIFSMKSALLSFSLFLGIASLSKANDPVTIVSAHNPITIYVVNQNQKPSITQRLYDAVSSLGRSIVKTAHNHSFLTSLATTIYLKQKHGFSVFGPLLDSFFLNPIVKVLTGDLLSKSDKA